MALEVVGENPWGKLRHPVADGHTPEALIASLTACMTGDRAEATTWTTREAGHRARPITSTATATEAPHDPQHAVRASGPVPVRVGKPSL